MGPANVALVKLYNAEMALRQAIARLEAASASVRAQQRRIADLTEKLRLAHAQSREHQAKAAQFDLDIKTFDAHIEKLREQQSSARNNKEYQAFLIEINTAKVDKAKVEDDTLAVMEQVEAANVQINDLQAQLDEQTRLHEATKSQLGSKLVELQREIDALRPVRDQAATAVPAKAREAFERLAERYDGQGMSPLSKPDKRREEYICAVCNMTLVVDVYNRLHSRDDLVFCTNCHRILFIPDDLPPDQAVNKAKPRKAEAPVSEPQQ